MPRVSQNLCGSPKRRLQPILILDEPLGIVALYYIVYSESCVLITSPATVKSKTGCVCRNQPGGTKSTQPPPVCQGRFWEP